MDAATAFLGAAFGLAVTGAVLAARRPAPPADEDTDTPPGRVVPWRRLALTAILAAAVFTATRWPVAAAAAALLAWFAPTIFGGAREFTAAIARIDAAAAWVESLRDNLVAATGLEATIVASARRVPPGLRPEIQAMAQHLRAGASLKSALLDFAAAANEAIVDDAVIAQLEARTSAGNLAQVLTRLAEEAREEAGRILRIRAARARIHTAARLITTVIVIMTTLLIAFGSSYLEPYNSAAGQVMLAVVFAIAALGLWSLFRLAHEPQPPSFLRPAEIEEAQS
ncbi:type II secretion system F family protein [Glycomyces sp. MUSA5-2]|uniref:type II secretion system F family protein n=1 Tax=Glycomyces sp. MUSA5-2 TaxID=2053002 RepID=UPI00300A575E